MDLQSDIRQLLAHSHAGPLYQVSVAAPVRLRGRGTPAPEVYLPGQSTLRHETVFLLQRLLAETRESDRPAFAQALVAELRLQNGLVVGHLLADMHRIEPIDGAIPSLDRLTQGWEQRLVHASNLFSETDLDAVERAAQTWLSGLPGLSPGERAPTALQVQERNFGERLRMLLQLVELVRFERLRRRLFDGQNPEIAEDRRRLVTIGASMGFPSKLSETLDVIDEKLAVASSGFDYNDCLNHIRTMLEKVFLYSAQAAALPLSHRAVTGSFRETRETLEKHALLAPKESLAVNYFYGFLSEEGVHAFTTAAEQARIARNVSIEWALLVVDRVRRRRAETGESGTVSQQ